jgi:hypothetical protein
LVYSMTLKVEAKCSSETSVDFQRTTWLHMAEDRTLSTDAIARRICSPLGIRAHAE